MTDDPTPPPRRRTPLTERYDWTATEMDYRSGVLNDQSISAKYGMTVGRLRQVAKEYEWVRGPAPTAADIYKSPIPGRVANSDISDAHITANAVATVHAILNTHRRDIASLRGNASLLIERLGLLITGTQITLPCLGARESPADLLEKLSRVVTRVVQMERQSFGLDSMPQNPGNESNKDDATVQAVMTEMEDMRKMLDMVGNAKAKEAVK